MKRLPSLICASAVLTMASGCRSEVEGDAEAAATVTAFERGEQHGALQQKAAMIREANEAVTVCLATGARCEVEIAHANKMNEEVSEDTRRMMAGSSGGPKEDALANTDLTDDEKAQIEEAATEALAASLHCIQEPTEACEANAQAEKEALAALIERLR